VGRVTVQFHGSGYNLSGLDISQGLFYRIKIAVREREKNQSFSTEGKR
jgi:hypothetical protein